MYNEARNNHEAYSRSMRRFAQEVSIKYMTFRSWVVKEEELREVYARSTQEKKRCRMRQKGPGIQFYCVYNISECLVFLI